MNYISQLNAFNKWIKGNVCSVSAQLLWYKLMAVNNDCGWIEWFAHTNAVLAGMMNVSENTLKAARNELKEKNLIDFRSGTKRGVPTKYKIILLYEQGIVAKIDSENEKASASVLKIDTQADAQIVNKVSSVDTQTAHIIDPNNKNIDIEKNSSCTSGCPTAIVVEYRKATNQAISEIIEAELSNLVDQYGTKQVVEAIHEAAVQNHVAQLRAIISDHITKQSQLITSHIEKLIAPYLAEKVLLQKERQVLLAEKTQFETKRKPKFFDPAYDVWKKESDVLQHKETVINEKETAIDEKITAIKNVVYDPQELEKSLPSSIEKTDIQKLQFTAREIQSLIHETLDSLISERNQINAQIKKLEHNIVDYPRAFEMAKNKFVKGAYKTLRADQCNLAKEAELLKNDISKYTERLNAFKRKKHLEFFKPQTEKNVYEQERKDLELLNSSIKSRQASIALRQSELSQKRTELDTKCSTSEAKSHIEKITQNIITASNPTSAEITHLQQKRTAITQKIDALTTTKKSIDSQVKYDEVISGKIKKQPVEYKLRNKAPLLHSSGGCTTQNNLPNPAQIIANAISGDSYAVPLIARIVDGEEYNFSAMTPEQIETAIAKIKIQQTL